MKRILQSCILAAMLLLVMRGEAQQRTVSGVVTSQDDGSALAGVSVVVEGTSVGATTNEQGNFSLSVPSNARRLVFSSQGYTTQMVTIGSGSMAVTMSRDIQQLTDVVVTALGITRAEKSLTYAAQVIGGSDLDVAKETNLINSLQGKVSGVVINRSAT